MKRTRLIGILVGLGIIATLAADGSAYYHPTLGRFLTRDPGPGSPMRVGRGGPAVGGGSIPRDTPSEYADGMNLYQYVRSNPIMYVDWQGAVASQPSSRPSSRPTSRPSTQPAVPPGDITFKVTNEMMANPPCGTLTFKGYKNMKHGPWKYKDVKAFGCVGWPVVMAAAISVADSTLKEYVKKKSTETFDCPEGQKCCNKKHYDGAYNVTLDVKLTAHDKQGPACLITGKITAKLTVTGDVGECK